MTMGEAQHGQRLDRALADLVPELSRSYLQQLMALGCVTLQGRPATKASTKVKVGDQATLEMRPTLQSQAFRPEAMALDIVYEDEHLLIVNKPAGLVVHPAPGNWSGTLLNGLLARDTKALLVPRAGIVHRLDKDTSGLMVVARDRATMDALVALIAARKVQRQYVALAHGAWTGQKSVTVDAPIGRDPRNRLRMAVVDLALHVGKTARTDVRLLDGADQGCWVQCTLHTGRTHQIRVHMAMLRHPLVGDTLYGGRRWKACSARRFTRSGLPLIILSRARPWSSLHRCPPTCVTRWLCGASATIWRNGPRGRSPKTDSRRALAQRCSSAPRTTDCTCC